MKLLLLILLSGSAAILAPSALRNVDPVGAQTAETFTGQIAGWRLELGGRIYVLLRHASVRDGADVHEETWFVSRPETTLTNQSEGMLLDVLLAQERADQPRPLIIHTKIERSLNGAEPSAALPLLSIGTR